MALPLLFIAGTVVRATAPRIISKLMQQGAKRATTSQIKKAGGKGNISTITNVKQVDKLKPKTPKLRGDRKIKPMDIKPFKSKGTDKGNLTSAQTRALQQRRSTAVDKNRSIDITPGTSVARTVQKGRGTSVPKGGRSGRDILQGTVNAPKARPSVPAGGARSAIGGKARGDAAIKALQASLGAALLAKQQKKKASTSTDPRGNQIKPTPGVKKKATTPAVKDPRGNQIKPTPGKRGKLSGALRRLTTKGYNSKTERLRNIDGVTYVFPKSQSTVKKMEGGRPSTEAKEKAKNMPYKPAKPKRTPKVLPKAKSMAGNSKFKMALKSGGTPSKYKGFSKLPEKVQKKMSPKLATKYKTGGSLKSGCARQVKGFGAARRPKK